MDELNRFAEVALPPSSQISKRATTLLSTIVYVQSNIHIMYNVQRILTDKTNDS